MIREQQSRPTGENGAALNNSSPDPILSRTIENGEAAEQLAGCLVLLVKVDNAHYRRRVFLSINAAQRALVAAREKGYSARVVACELHPLTVGGAL